MMKCQNKVISVENKIAGPWRMSLMCTEGDEVREGKVSGARDFVSRCAKDKIHMAYLGGNK